jgi:UDP-N-acetylmuramoyl-tripeptide--D-alanyl-D-alanine ligase
LLYYVSMKAIITRATLSYLRFWARIALRLHKPYIIGITGSVGKSTCRDVIFAAIKDSVKVLNLGSANSQSGIPLALLGLTAANYSAFDWLSLCTRAPFGIFYIKNYTHVIIEMGIDGPNYPSNMRYLTTIVEPHCSIFLNAGAVHAQQFIEGLPNGKNLTTAQIVQEIAKEKAYIVNSSTKIAMYNAEDAQVANAVEYRLSELNKGTIAYPFYPSLRKGDVYCKEYSVTIGATGFVMQAYGEELVISLEDYVLPKEFAASIIATLYVAKSLHIPYKTAATSLQKNILLPSSRSSFFNGIHNSVILDSSYNASKHSVLALLATAHKLTQETKRPLVVLLGDMRELGASSKDEHEAVAEELLQKADYIYLVGEETKKYIESLVVSRLSQAQHNQHQIKEVMHFENSKKAGEYLAKHLPEHAVVLVKGSQNTIFLEEAIKYMLANAQDEKKLCRQSEYWMNVKKKYFEKA